MLTSNPHAKTVSYVMAVKGGDSCKSTVYNISIKYYTISTKYRQ